MYIHVTNIYMHVREFQYYSAHEIINVIQKGLDTTNVHVYMLISDEEFVSIYASFSCLIL